MDSVGPVIYIFGGFYHNNFLETLYSINSGTLEIQLLDADGIGPERRAYHCSMSIGNMIVVYGGINDKKIFNDMFVLDTIVMRWY